MSGNIAVIYAGDVEPVAEAFADAAAHLATGVRLLRLYGEWIRPTGNARQPHLADLEWANGIPFGTPIGRGRPAPELMEFIDGTDPLWRSGRLFDKAVTVFTDEPERYAPDSL